MSTCLHCEGWGCRHCVNQSDENRQLQQLVDLAAAKLARSWRCDSAEVRASLEAEHALSHPVPR